MKTLKTKLYSLAKQLQFRTPLRRYMLYRYQYFFWPEELGYLCQLLSETGTVSGNIAEIGCASGCTTVFLNKHLDFLEKNSSENSGANDLAYYCLDTFSGFTPEDIEHEVEKRNKYREEYFVYSINDIRWFEAMLKTNGVTRTQAIEADATRYDFSQLGKIRFCLIDVDLYQPVQSSLEGIYPHLAPGGIIVVDDCKPDTKWDGALQAYQEFIAANDLPEDIQYGKFGIVKKCAGTV